MRAVEPSLLDGNDVPLEFRPAAQPPKRRNLLDSWELNSITRNGEFCTIAQARPIGQYGEFLYAIKQLTPKWRRSHIGHAIMKHEFELGRRISHPHVVPVLDGETDGDEPFLVQPWLQGETLQHFLAQGRVMPPNVALWIGRQVAEALAELERHEHCHSDVKPANIMISDRGHVTLIDLGLARRMGERCLPPDQIVTGTPKYMAPELWESPSEVDIRADIFSLGLVMLEMLFGTVMPLSGEKPQRCRLTWRTCWNALTAKYSGNASTGRILNELEPLLAAMTTADPAARPVSAGDLVRKLISLELDSI